MFDNDIISKMASRAFLPSENGIGIQPEETGMPLVLMSGYAKSSL